MSRTVIHALIIPLKTTTSPGGEHPDNTLPGSQPHPDQGLPGPGSAGGEHPWVPEGSLPHPENPIFWPLPPGAPVDPDYGIPAPPGEEGGAPRPDQGLPGSQPRPDHGLPPFPSHPIVLPPGGGNWLPVYIDNSLPGRGSAGGEHPDNTLPGSQPHPDHELPGSQPRPDHGLPPFPSHPIVLPPDQEVPPAWGISGTIKFKAIWTPENGWQTIAIVIPGTDGEGRPVPTPSKKRK